MGNIYRCPNNCTVSDNWGRCKRCDQFLLKDGTYQDDDKESFEEAKRQAEEKTRNIQLSKI